MKSSISAETFDVDENLIDDQVNDKILINNEILNGENEYIRNAFKNITNCTLRNDDE